MPLGAYLRFGGAAADDEDDDEDDDDGPNTNPSFATGFNADLANAFSILSKIL